MAFFAESLEARCQVENEDVVGAAPTGDAPTTYEWSTILLSTKVRLILEVLRYMENVGLSPTGIESFSAFAFDYFQNQPHSSRKIVLLSVRGWHFVC